MATSTPANITTATPVEIDTRLAELYRAELEAEGRVEDATDQLRRMLGEKPVKVSRAGRKTWRSTNQEALAAARARGTDTVPRYSQARTFADEVAKVDAKLAALLAILDEQKPLDAEFARRGGWTRFFIVQNNGGHIHASMHCQTCNRGMYRTEFAWIPEMSGMVEADALAQLAEQAHTLCTVCFPNAPVLPAAPSTYCPGSGVSPVKGTSKTTGMRTYGDCTRCDERPLVTAYNVTRKHKPAGEFKPDPNTPVEALVVDVPAPATNDETARGGQTAMPAAATEDSGIVVGRVFARTQGLDVPDGCGRFRMVKARVGARVLTVYDDDAVLLGTIAEDGHAWRVAPAASLASPRETWTFAAAVNVLTSRQHAELS